MSTSTHHYHRQRMFERADKTGLDSFADHELLEYMLFFTQARKNTNNIAHGLIEEFGSFENVLDANFFDLQKVSGVGPNSARFLNLFLYVLKRYNSNKTRPKQRITNVREAGEYLSAVMMHSNKEEVYILLLDVKSRIIRLKCIAQGTIDEVPLYVREVVAEAIRSNSKKVILAHCHPNGSFNASKNDIDLTISLNKALSTVNISLLDHIIVSKEGYASILANIQLKAHNGSKDILSQYEIDYEL
ncbi:MAG: DNA repair protein RadC [Eubacteriales bacterium]